jgi:hypothetical protein
MILESALAFYISLGKWGKSQDKGLRGFLSPCTNDVPREFWSSGSSVGGDF